MVSLQATNNIYEPPLLLASSQLLIEENVNLEKRSWHTYISKLNQFCKMIDVTLTESCAPRACDSLITFILESFTLRQTRVARKECAPASTWTTK